MRNLTCLLLAGDPTQRPDGLLLLDDHFADQVGLGVIDAGRAGKVHLVACGNLPPPEHLPVPVTWMGWRLQEMLSAAICDLASARAGTKFPGSRIFQPRQYIDSTIAQAG